MNRKLSETQRYQPGKMKQKQTNKRTNNEDRIVRIQTVCRSAASTTKLPLDRMAPTAAVGLLLHMAGATVPSTGPQGSMQSLCPLRSLHTCTHAHTTSND